jgi:protein gp37
MKGTGIGWAHPMWNPWIGCNEVSRECDGCYARTLVENNEMTALLHDFPRSWPPQIGVAMEEVSHGLS